MSLSLLPAADKRATKESAYEEAQREGEADRLNLEQAEATKTLETVVAEAPAKEVAKEGVVAETAFKAAETEASQVAVAKAEEEFTLKAAAEETARLDEKKALADSEQIAREEATAKKAADEAAAEALHRKEEERP